MNDSKSIADISTNKRFFKKKKFNLNIFQKTFRKSASKILDSKNDQSFKKKNRQNEISEKLVRSNEKNEFTKRFDFNNK